jgi:hypothetical protein
MKPVYYETVNSGRPPHHGCHPSGPSKPPVRPPSHVFEDTRVFLEGNQIVIRQGSKSWRFDVSKVDDANIILEDDVVKVIQKDLEWVIRFNNQKGINVNFDSLNVKSINGTRGDVILNGDNLYISNKTKETISQVFWALKEQVEEFSSLEERVTQTQEDLIRKVEKAKEIATAAKEKIENAFSLTDDKIKSAEEKLTNKIDAVKETMDERTAKIKEVATEAKDQAIKAADKAKEAVKDAFENVNKKFENAREEVKTYITDTSEKFESRIVSVEREIRSIETTLDQRTEIAKEAAKKAEEKAKEVVTVATKKLQDLENKVDTNIDSFVSKSNELDSANTAQDTKISTLERVAERLKNEIVALKSISSIRENVDTYADLPAPNKFPIGSSIVVEKDEKHGGISTIYTTTGTEWGYTGQFTVDLTNYYKVEDIDNKVEKLSSMINEKADKTRINAIVEEAKKLAQKALDKATETVNELQIEISNVNSKLDSRVEKALEIAKEARAEALKIVNDLKSEISKVDSKLDSRVEKAIEIAKDTKEKALDLIDKAKEELGKLTEETERLEKEKISFADFEKAKDKYGPIILGKLQKFKEQLEERFKNLEEMDKFLENLWTLADRNRVFALLDELRPLRDAPTSVDGKDLIPGTEYVTDTLRKELRKVIKEAKDLLGIEYWKVGQATPLIKKLEDALASVIKSVAPEFDDTQKIDNLIDEAYTALNINVSENGSNIYKNEYWVTQETKNELERAKDDLLANPVSTTPFNKVEELVEELEKTISDFNKSKKYGFKAFDEENIVDNGVVMGSFAVTYINDAITSANSFEGYDISIATFASYFNSLDQGFTFKQWIELLEKAEEIMGNIPYEDPNEELAALQSVTHLEQWSRVILYASLPGWIDHVDIIPPTEEKTTGERVEEIFNQLLDRLPSQVKTRIEGYIGDIDIAEYIDNLIGDVEARISELIPKLLERAGNLPEEQKAQIYAGLNAIPQNVIDALPAQVQLAFGFLKDFFAPAPEPISIPVDKFLEKLDELFTTGSAAMLGSYYTDDVKNIIKNYFESNNIEEITGEVIDSLVDSIVNSMVEENRDALLAVIPGGSSMMLNIAVGAAKTYLKNNLKDYFLI